MCTFIVLSFALCVFFNMQKSLSILPHTLNDARRALIAKDLLLHVPGNISHSPTTEYYYHPIPHTTRTMHLCVEPYNYINVEAFDIVIMDADEQVQQHILAHGDSPLLPQDISYEFSVRNECYLHVMSSFAEDGTPLMTYGMLREIFDVLALAMRDRVSEVSWLLVDLYQNPLGRGSVVERPYSATS